MGQLVGSISGPTKNNKKRFLSFFFCKMFRGWCKVFVQQIFEGSKLGFSEDGRHFLTWLLLLLLVVVVVT